MLDFFNFTYLHFNFVLSTLKNDFFIRILSNLNWLFIMGNFKFCSLLLIKIKYYPKIHMHYWENTLVVALFFKEAKFGKWVIIHLNDIALKSLIYY